MALGSSELKARLLELLERDKEFRYAVAGLIGLDAILSELRRLREDFNRHAEMSERRFQEINERFEAIERRFEEINERFMSIERRFEEIIKRFEALERRFEEVNKRFEAIDRRFEAVDRRFEEVYRRFEAIERVLEEHTRVLREHTRALGRIGAELGILAESFYCRSLWEDLREELRLRGERVVERRRRARVDGVEVDLLVVTDRRVYVVEVKAMPGHEDVGALLAKAEVVAEHYPDREVVAVLAGACIGREVEEYARRKGVETYSY